MRRVRRVQRAWREWGEGRVRRRKTDVRLKRGMWPSLRLPYAAQLPATGRLQVLTVNEFVSVSVCVYIVYWNSHAVWVSLGCPVHWVRL